MASPLLPGPTTILTTGPGLDAIQKLPMWRPLYRNFASHETLVGNLVTDVDGTDHGSIRWLELRRSPPGSVAWTLFQEGSCAQGGDHRWTEGIAMDGCGDIGLGYGVTGNATLPGIRHMNGTSSAIPFVVDLEGPVGCATQVAFTLPLADCTAGGGVAAAPGEVPRDSLMVTKDPALNAGLLRVDWAAVPGAGSYNLYRGDFAGLHASGGAYNHVRSAAANAGTCGEPNLLFQDLDDLLSSSGKALYYLVTASSSCGLEGPTGYDSAGSERAAGGGCP